MFTLLHNIVHVYVCYVPYRCPNYTDTQVSYYTHTHTHTHTHSLSLSLSLSLSWNRGFYQNAKKKKKKLINQGWKTVLTFLFLNTSQLMKYFNNGNQCCGENGNVLNCDLKMREFQSNYYVHFHLEKVFKPVFASCGLNSINTVLQGWPWH